MSASIALTVDALRPASGNLAEARPATPTGLTRLAPPGRLALWVAFQVLAATGAIVVLIAGGSLHPEIALPWPGVPSGVALAAGLGFWLAFGLLGGVRARERPGGGVLTFSLPFIVGGTLLGGPLAGGLLGLVSELELREIRTQPWYGILANHAVSMLSAIGGALVGDAIRPVLTSLVPAQPSLVFFLVAMVTAFVFVVINLVLIIPTLALKGELSLAEASRSNDASFRATSFAEGILAWLMAATYLLVGWWAPIVCIALVLVTWQAHDRSEAIRHDEKTGLLNDLGFKPRLDAAIAAARSGRRTGAFLLLDLDGFKAINDTWLYAAGDEVLVATARRLLAAVRATDSVGRMNRAGDEFAVVLEEVAHPAVAMRLAERIQARIREPVRLRSREGMVQVDVSIGIVFLERGTSMTRMEVVSLADARMLRGKTAGSGVVAEGADDQAAHDERAAAPSRRR